MGWEITVTCPSCADAHSRLRERKPAWAQLAGFEAVEWAADLKASPGEVWPRLPEPPVVGREFALRARHSFSGAQGEAVWILFVPPYSSMNGWLDCPAEMGVSALAQCRLSDLLARDEKQAWITAIILDTIGVREITRRFEPDPAGSVAQGFSREETFHWEDLSHFSWNAEGDLGAWLVCRTNGVERAAVLYGDWGGHTDFVYAGHRPLTDVEWQRLTEQPPLPADYRTEPPALPPASTTSTTMVKALGRYVTERVGSIFRRG